MTTVLFAFLFLCLTFQAKAQTTYTYREGEVEVTVTETEESAELVATTNKRGASFGRYFSPPSSPSPSAESETSPSPSPPSSWETATTSHVLSYEDYSTTEKRLRTYILKGDVARAAQELRSMDIFGQARGMTYPPELAPLVEQSGDRNHDPDVVAFRALAKAALITCDADRLATVVMMSFTPDCACSVFTSEEEDALRKDFVSEFSDPKAMLEVLSSDANQDEVSGDRRLLQTGRSPVSSFACAHCWPRRQCRRLHWC